MVLALNTEMLTLISKTLNRAPQKMGRSSKTIAIGVRNVGYDFATEKKRDNIRIAMTQDPIVAQFLQISAETTALIEKNSTGRMASLGEDYIQLEMSRAQILDKIYHKYLSPNDLCTCNSGKKVKKCCGLEAAKTILRRGQ